MDNRSKMQIPFVSVIIPVLNDTERLKICLEALESQTYPKDNYEIIVVDNDSYESIGPVVSGFGQVKLGHESRRGAYVARNRGTSLAKGEILAFTDSDCIPAPDWIDKGVANLLRVPNCGLVAGRIEFIFKNQDKPTAVELYDSIKFLQQERYIEVAKFSTTANLFTFKSVFENIGCFNDMLKSSGDKDWGQRVFSTGYELIYADDTCVAHPARHSLDQLYRKIVRITRGKEELKMLERTPLQLKTVSTYTRIISTLQDERVRGIKNKINVFFITLFVLTIKIWETIRLRIGRRFGR